MNWQGAEAMNWQGAEAMNWQGAEAMNDHQVALLHCLAEAHAVGPAQIKHQQRFALMGVLLGCTRGGTTWVHQCHKARKGFCRQSTLGTSC